ncbi:MAG: replication-relaxation family protein [Pseudonocardiaceae bacterium]
MREHRVTGAAAERIAEGLSRRDQAIADTVRRVRVVTGRQLERLHFAELLGAHRDRTRRRVLARLTDLQVLTTLDRRIGGARAGSAGLVFALGVVGQRLAALLPHRDNPTQERVRRPGSPTDRFLKHSLAVSELYVQLVELARHQHFTLAGFRAEPACWWQDSTGNWIKPDAYVCLETADLTDSWAIEVDRATESPSTIRHKLSVYLQLVELGDNGPDGDVLPRVLITVPDEQRRTILYNLIQELPDPAMRLFTVVLHENAARFTIEVLRE